MKKVSLLLVALLLTLGLAACGKKVKPEYPEGTDFPHSYPRQ
jgi:predicted small lipoprotein YifL